MRTFIYNTETQQKTLYPNGLIVEGVSQPLGQLAPTIYQLEEYTDPQPEINTETHFLRQLPPFADLENNKWRTTWESVEIPPPVVEIPDKLTPRQLRLGLLQEKGIVPGVITTMLGDNQAALIEWEYSSYIERAHPMVTMLATALGMNEQDVDNFFVLASAL